MESKGLDTKIGEHVRMVISTREFVGSRNHPLARPINSLYDLAGSRMISKKREGSCIMTAEVDSRLLFV